MNKKLTLTGFVIVACCIVLFQKTTISHEPHKTLFMGTIQWPMDLKKVPLLRIYHAGRTLSVESNNETRQLTYTVPESSDITVIPLIITAPCSITLKMAEDNTIQHLTIAKKASYKYFQLIHTEYDPLIQFSHEATKDTPTESWRVEEQKLDDSGILPDDALILCCDPSWISKISGGSSINLPTVYICDDLLKKIASEKDIHEAADLSLLSCLNLDTIHTKLTFDIKQSQKTNLVALT